MKFIFITIVFCFTAFNGFAEVILRGTITYQNTGEKMKVLQVTARGASPTITRTNTNTEGVFILTFPNGKVGDLVTLELGTPIYDLVNDSRELNVTLTDNPNYKIRLVVCKKGERDANAVKYYNISTEYLEKNYQKQVKKKDAEIVQLQKQLTQNGTNTDALNKQIYDLYAQKAKLDEELEAQKKNAFKMAEDFSRIDLAQADAIYRKAFETFKNGDIEGARQVLNSKEAKQQEADLKKLDADILKSESQVQKVKDSLKVAEQKIANAKGQRDTLKTAVIKKKFLDGQLAILQNKYDEAERLYTDGVRLDSTNVYNFGILALFLDNQNKKLKAITYYERAIFLSKSDDLIGTLYNNIGAAYSDINNMLEAEKYYMQSFEIRVRLSKSNPQQVEPYLATTAMNLGIYYQTVNNMPEAEKYYMQSFEIRARLSKSNPQQFEPDLARTANNMGEFYRANNKMPEAEKYYMQSLDIYKRLVKSDPQQFEDSFAKTLECLGIYYQMVNKMPEAEKYYMQSLDIYKRLVKSNPKQFEDSFAKALECLGIYYQTVNKMPKAEKYYMESFGIREWLVKSNPQQFEPDLGLTQYNVGVFYQEQKAYTKAETYLISALAIYEKWEKVSPSVFGDNRKKMWGVVKAFYEEWQAAVSSITEKIEIDRKLIDLLARE